MQQRDGLASVELTSPVVHTDRAQVGATTLLSYFISTAAKQLKPDSALPALDHAVHLFPLSSCIS